jgi:hypothetical protein
MTTACASDPGQDRPPPQYEPALAALAGAADTLSAANLAEIRASSAPISARVHRSAGRRAATDKA